MIYLKLCLLLGIISFVFNSPTTICSIESSNFIYKKDLIKMRKTIRYFRRSSLASHYFSKTFKSLLKFTRPLPPSQDVETTSTSTLHLLKRYLRVDTVLYNVPLDIVNSNAKLNGDAAGSPFAANLEDIYSPW